MVYKYYRLNNGKIISTIDLYNAFEIETGRYVCEDEEMFNRWKNRLISVSMEEIMPNDSFVKYFVSIGECVKAVKLYKEIHNCTLRESLDFVNSLRD